MKLLRNQFTSFYKQKNSDEFKKKFLIQFNENPNHLSLLSYDLVGLIYYLSLKNNVTEINKVFKTKNSFKGKLVF